MMKFNVIHQISSMFKWYDDLLAINLVEFSEFTYYTLLSQVNSNVRIHQSILVLCEKNMHD